MNVASFAERPIRLGRPRLQGRLRRVGRDQGIAAGADQLLPPCLLKGLADLEVILGLEELEQGALELAVAEVAGDVDLFARERVEFRVVHAGRDVAAHPYKDSVYPE